MKGVAKEINHLILPKIDETNQFQNLLWPELTEMIFQGNS